MFRSVKSLNLINFNVLQEFSRGEIFEIFFFILRKEIFANQYFRDFSQEEIFFNG